MHLQIREEPPSYESHAFEKDDSFMNPLAGSASRSFGSQDEERVSSGTPRPGTALYDFTAGGDDEVNPLVQLVLILNFLPSGG